MEFRARVQVAPTVAEQERESETARAKSLLLEAFNILAKNDSDIMAEAEKFLEGVKA